MLSRGNFIGVIVLAGLMAPGCGGGSTPERPAATAKADGPGSITGKVTFDGEPPGRTVIRMGADPNCRPHEPVKVGNVTGAMSDALIVGSDRAIKDVFVYVKDGLGNYIFDTPTTPAKIDQQNCRYHPHVFGIRVNQPLEIVNSDPTLHNIHAQPKANSEFNNGQPIQGMKMTHTFDKKEVMVPFKCDVHGWMNAYLAVMDHPYYAITGADGKFSLKGLPPGTYTVEAWHEKAGTQTAQVTIGAKETKEANFTFKAGATATD